MIVVKVDNPDGIKKAEQKLQRRFSSLYIKNIQFAYMTKSLIIANLYQVLGEKNKHFVVQVSSTSHHKQVIKVRAKDNIGLFIYHGTKKHHISSSGSMPIGNGLFAGSVDHPGSKSRKSEIDEAVRKAVRQSRAYYRMLR